MAVDLRVYDNEHGDPVVVMVTTGMFDVSRLAGLLERGRVEDFGRYKALLRALVRHNTGRMALKLLADHGGPDLLERVPDQSELTKALRRAIADPGQVVRREYDHMTHGYEPLPAWQLRAVLGVVGPLLAGLEPVDA